MLGVNCLVLEFLKISPVTSSNPALHNSSLNSIICLGVWCVGKIVVASGVVFTVCETPEDPDLGA